jgi:membrane-associated phospholipid phosphatase
MATHNRVPNYLLLEKATFIYMVVLSGLILFFHTNLPHWLNLLGFNLCICLFMFVVATGINHRTGGWWHFFRHFYPVLFFIALYEENRYLIHMVFPNLFDNLVNQFELAIFGVHPTVWMQKYISFGLSEYMMFSYVFYYFLILSLGLGLYFSHKVRELDLFFFTVTITFFFSYLGFIFFPVAGPRFALAGLHQKELGGGLISHFVQNFMYSAGIKGAAMPSSHVAIALVVLIYARRYHRILFYVLSPFVFSLFVSTVYGRFHYVSDVFAGFLVGGLGIWICDKIIKKQKTSSPPMEIKEEFSLDLTRSD